MLQSSVIIHETLRLRRMPKYLFLAIIVLLTACGGGRHKPDVSNIKVDLRLERFERDFFKIDTNNIRGGLVYLRNAYPDFYPIYLQNILQVNPADTASFALIRSIISGYRPINDSIQKKYKDLGWLKDDLTQSFKYVKHYYPDYFVPRVITFIGTFDAPGAILSPQYLGIGLHQFAGKHFSVYQTEAIAQMYPSYISQRFDKEYITAGAMKAVVDDIYPDQSVGNPLIEQMVEKGKQWYLLDHFLPDAPDSVKTGFSGVQLDWVEENEGNTWGYIIKNENLYSIEPVTIQTYLGEAPFTQGFPETSPGNIGQWVGWRIVQKFADEHPKLTLQQILAKPAKEIFEQSKYKPK
ncbi:MAG: hypothetical protein JWP88_591 [Flaviaesturariibacter sp.]|nr:hypothetical protein [Flaviaesturariibacter sp.]